MEKLRVVLFHPDQSGEDIEIQYSIESLCNIVGGEYEVQQINHYGMAILFNPNNTSENSILNKKINGKRYYGTFLITIFEFEDIVSTKIVGFRSLENKEVGYAIHNLFD